MFETEHTSFSTQSSPVVNKFSEGVPCVPTNTQPSLLSFVLIILANGFCLQSPLELQPHGDTENLQLASEPLDIEVGWRWSEAEREKGPPFPQHSEVASRTVVGPSHGSCDFPVSLGYCADPFRKPDLSIYFLSRLVRKGSLGKL